MKPLFFIFLCIQLIWNPLLGQELHFEQIEFPYKHPLCMTQSDDGHIWFGHHYGLIRYDGSNYKMFAHNADDPESIISGRIFQIVAQDSFLWLGSDTGGLSKFNRYTHKAQNWINNGNPNSLASNNIGGILVENDTVVWVGTSSFCLNRINTQTNNVNRYYPDLPYEWINGLKDAGSLHSILVDPDDPEILWIGSAFGLYKFNTHQNTFELKTPLDHQKSHSLKASCRDLILDYNGDIWASTGISSDPGEGIARYNRQKNKWKRFKVYEGPEESTYSNRISEAALFDENKILAGSRLEGPWLIDTKEETITLLSDELNAQGIPISDIYTVCQTKDGDNWIGSNALIRVVKDRNAFNYVNFADHFLLRDRYNWSNCFAEDVTSKNIYIGTANGNGLIVTDQDFKTFQRIPIYDRSHIHDMCPGDHSTLFLATNNGLLKYDSASNKINLISWDETNVLNSNILHLREEGDSLLWMINTQAVLIKYNLLNNHTTTFKLQDEGRINDLEIDRSGIWLATNTGVKKYDVNQDTVQLLFELKGLDINDVALDENRVYLGTAGQGLKVLDSRDPDATHISTYDVGDGLSGNVIFNIIVLQNGNLWLGSEPGFTQVFKEENIFTQFLVQDGIQFSRQSGPLFQLEDGRILTSGARGFGFYFPEKKPPGKYIPQVRIDEIEVMGESRVISDVLHLNSKERTFTIQFSSIDLCIPVKSRFEYTLEGAEENWTRRFEPGEVSYSNLSPGDYTFKIKVANNKGVWSDTKSIHFKIEAPITARWWFWFLLILLVTGVLLIIHNLRLNQVRKVSSIKSDFEKRLAKIEMDALRAQMNPHFLFNSLNSINNVIIKRDSKEASNYLTKFARLIRIILQNSKSQKVILDDELSALRLYIEMESLRFEDKFEYRIDVSDEIDVEDTYIAPMLIQPYIENAIWHGLMHKTGKGLLKISVNKENNVLVCTIEDNGIGRKKAAELKSKSSTHKSFGMQITNNRIETVNKIYGINASVKIEDLFVDQTAAGTRITINIPILNSSNTLS